MEKIKHLLSSLTQKICNILEATEIPKRNLWTVVESQDEPPHVVLDVDRPVLPDLLFSLDIGLPSLPEYDAVVEAIESDPELEDGIIIDAGGTLRKPERLNNTRALVTHFLGRYLRDGEHLDWDVSRFEETFNELNTELHQKTVVRHTIMPLSNLKMGVASLEFSDELVMLPASIKELEQWLNREQRGLSLVGSPHWNVHHIDKPAVLHARHIIVGHQPSTDEQVMPQTLDQVNINQIITALRLVFNSPVSTIFQEQQWEGMMSIGGISTSWGLEPPPLGPVSVLDDEKATQVIRVWHLLQESQNIGVIGLPLRRWESSLLRRSLEDRLIDAWISLESFLLGGKEGELNYRAAILLAEFLGASGSERKEIFNATRLSYKWRSRIVHGLSTKKLTKTAPLQGVVHVTTENLRSALLKVLSSTTKFNPNKLETELLSRGS